MKILKLFPIDLSHVIILFLTILFGTSCSHRYYAPNDGDLLVLRKKNDVHISGGGQNLITNENNVSKNVQVGYSPISHLAITGSYFKLRKNDAPIKGGNGHIWSGAVGGYYFFQQEKEPNLGNDKSLIFYKGPIKMEKGILVDLYLGLSDGTVNNYYANGSNSKFKFQKYYAQLGLHFIRPNWGIDYVIRGGQINYYKGIAYGDIAPENRDEIDAIGLKNNYGLSELSTRVHFGARHIRYFVTTTVVLQNSEIKEIEIYEGNGSLGLIIEIDEFFRKNKKFKNKKIF